MCLLQVWEDQQGSERVSQSERQKEKISPAKGSWRPEENMKRRREKHRRRQEQGAKIRKKGWKIGRSDDAEDEFENIVTDTPWRLGLKLYITDNVEDFLKRFLTSQRRPVHTYAGPKLLQERVFLRGVWRRQDLHSVVTRQLDAHEAKWLRREKKNSHFIQHSIRCKSRER